jgi:thymidine kinase
VVAVKPALDTRYGQKQIISHDGNQLPAVNVTAIHEIRAFAAGSHVVGIDEVHFFEESLVGICRELAGAGVRVVAAGVEIDHRGRPFEVVERLAAAAQAVTRLTAICGRCGAPARHSQRLVSDDARIVVGGMGMYEPRCDRCFQPVL